ncbi:DUF397 domain-containing protein [Actinomadura kijaniata]|uniref:DUF397 domain-containing protein n=1 Tax=Actinomadura kijaniata TaxID=46161 RepID=UPI0009FE6ACF|nr:DUF397 domain-containing protein [Actinomadura kijaniata]
MSAPPNRETRWRKSSHSSGQGTQCVEVAVLTNAEGVAARDSKDASGPVLVLSPAGWRGLLSMVKREG